MKAFTWLRHLLDTISAINKPVSIRPVPAVSVLVVSLSISYVVTYNKIQDRFKEEQKYSLSHYSQVLETPQGGKLIYASISEFDNCFYLVLTTPDGQIVHMNPLDPNCLPISVLEFRIKPPVKMQRDNIQIFK